MHIKIREITPVDYPSMATLLKSEQEHSWVFPSALYPMSEQEIKTRALSREFIMIEQDEVLVGFANLYQEEGHLFIGNFAISQAYRRRGYGKKLLIIMRERARAKYGAKELRISVVKENSVAMGLYEGFGFSRCGMEIFLSPKGEYLSFIHLKMAL